jgi:integrase
MAVSAIMMVSALTGFPQKRELPMPRQRARVLVQGDVCRLLDHVAHRRYPDRDRVIILLSFNAGLRACEIAGIGWTMVLDTDGRVAETATISGTISKGGVGRAVPLSPPLRTALKRLHKVSERPTVGPVIRSERGCHMTPRSIVNWFATTYQELELVGCSSHSGRRTFITRAARLVSKTGGSLRDVQELAGHRSLTTTALRSADSSA